MTMPTLSNLSSLTQLTELALSDVHNRLSLPGLQHLPCLSNLRSALLVTCNAMRIISCTYSSLQDCTMLQAFDSLVNTV